MTDENVFLTDLCRRLFSCNVMMLRPNGKDLEAFEEKYCFRPQLQPFFTEKGLRTLLSSIRDNVFYVLSDKLHLVLAFFRFQREIFLIGPFSTAPSTAASIDRDTEGIPLTLSQRRLLYIYCSAYPVLDAEYVMKTVLSILRSLEPAIPVYSIRYLKGFYEEIRDSGELSEEERDDRQVETIRQKYEVENRLLDYIRHGETQKALRQFRAITSQYTGQKDPSLLPLYQDPNVSMAILRALWRKAAEEGGLSVIIIDELTQLQAQQSMKASSMAEQLRTMDRLLRDLCEAVRQTREETAGCSAETKAVLEYISLHLSGEIRMEDITKETGYSKSHISDLFKADTGRTIREYIAERRCEKAAELLISTSLPIQDISFRVGYPDNNYFVKVFKNQYGFTPSAFRRNKGGNQVT